MIVIFLTINLLTNKDSQHKKKREQNTLMQFLFIFQRECLSCQAIKDFNFQPLIISSNCIWIWSPWLFLQAYSQAPTQSKSFLCPLSMRLRQAVKKNEEHTRRRMSVYSHHAQHNFQRSLITCSSLIMESVTLNYLLEDVIKPFQNQRFGYIKMLTF